MKDTYPEIVFGFDQSWEFRNWYQTCTQKVAYGTKDGNDQWNLGDIPPAIREVVIAETSESAVLKKMSPLFEDFIKSDTAIETREKIIERAQGRWNKVGEKYFSALSSMLEVPVHKFEKQYFAFFTYSRRCPFNGNRFMFNRFNDFSNTASHEIMHIEFLKKYTPYCKEVELSDMQISHLKEILTVLLNVDMVDVLFRPDQGYKKHEAIRPQVLKLYEEQKKEGKNFSSFLNKTISLIKKEEL